MQNNIFYGFHNHTKNVRHKKHFSAFSDLPVCTLNAVYTLEMFVQRYEGL